jgi:hypothetical protein
MLTHEKILLLISLGLRKDLAESAVLQMETSDEKNKKTKFDRDFSAILAPLTHQIKSLISTRTRWSQDSLRFPVYSAYVKLLQKTKKVIKDAAASAKMKGQTVSVCAASYGITEFDGRRWYVWIPQRVRNKYIVMFQDLSTSLAERKRTHNIPQGRIVTPFVCATLRSANERRWEILEAKIVGLQNTYPQTSDIQPLLRSALTTLRARTVSTPTPMQWAHLLTRPERKSLSAWKKQTMNGLREEIQNGQT